MACNHEHIKSVNCVLFCADCGAELPQDFLKGAPAKAAETPADGQETPPKRTRKRKAV